MSQILEFKEIRSLFGITENNGFLVEEIALHKAVCEHIPQVLHDYYANLGKIDALNHTQDQLLSPNKLKFSKNNDFLIFYAENQYACAWGIKKEDLTHSNPPVYMSADEIKWQQECETLSDFLNAMAHLQAVFALPFNCEDFLFINEEEKSFITKNFKKKNCCFTQWIGIEFYGDADTDVIAVFGNQGNYDLLYASNDKQQFEKMDSLLGSLGEN